MVIHLELINQNLLRDNGTVEKNNWSKARITKPSYTQMPLLSI